LHPAWFRVTVILVSSNLPPFIKERDMISGAFYVIIIKKINKKKKKISLLCLFDSHLRHKMNGHID
jgi:hypothetical protein